MGDAGLDGDAVAGDGIYSALIPPQANNTVIEWYIQASDLEGHSRTWPAPAIAAADGVGPSGQVVNALFQVDDTVYAGPQPLYKLIMTEAERVELAGIPAISDYQGPNSQMNATFISLDGAGISRRYLVGLRNRGHYSRTITPMGYRLNFRNDDPWKGITGINLNTRYVHAQHFGAVLARISGADGRDGVGRAGPRQQREPGGERLAHVRLLCRPGSLRRGLDRPSLPQRRRWECLSRRARHRPARLQLSRHQR